MSILIENNNTSFSFNTDEIIDRMKLFLNQTSDINLSKKIGKSANYISKCRFSKSIDFETVVKSCPDADFNWLLTGKKDKPCRIADLDSKGNRIEVDASFINNSGSQSSANEPNTMLTDNNTQKLMQEKDTTIQELSRNMLQLQRLLAEYQLREKKE